MERTAPLCLKPGLLNDHILRRSCLAFIPISFLFSAPASLAQSEDETPFFTFSGNAALVSDYRFRGVSLSDEDIAIQGGFTVDTEPGFYLGVWGSSIESFNGSETEVDVNFGYGTTWKGFDLSAGVTAYLFPGGTDTDYVELISRWGAVSALSAPVSE
ncbi:hypothetical protein JCM17845_05680 [Iodidimonas gelatinilytica]|uniref:Uncharacterized protein n=1 Tax=Iodidimonas gelatinilytica TaxID=1236966 RepID=A0A5A7MWW8_9PROT|nr:TorF family putative porin [Iodidimonas gelatinilytica]GEQ99944.1 hypothetical protein JCM17845_05680 [Iodidimonas gelatinilytica]